MRGKLDKSCGGGMRDFSLLTWCPGPPGPALAGLGDLRLESREHLNSSILDDTTYMRAISQFYITFHNHIHLQVLLPPHFSTTLKNHVSVSVCSFKNGLFIRLSFPALKNHYHFFLMAPPHSLQLERRRPCSQIPAPPHSLH